jgi:DNA-binding IclR family transcriptional regulator
MSRKYQAPTVRKAFQILELVSRSAARLTLSDISRELSISKSTVHGIAAALEEAGALVRDPDTRRYAPGMTLYELGLAAHARIDLKDAARPHMEDLAGRTQESVFLGMRSGEHVFILDIVESAQELKITSPVGTRIPLLAGATGKVFLAAMSEEHALEILRSRSLTAYTSRTITDPEVYVEEIRAARRQGFAMDDEEYISGVRAVASPIPADGPAASAIWVVGLSARMPGETMERIGRETRRAAEAIGRACAA